MSDTTEPSAPPSRRQQQARRAFLRSGVLVVGVVAAAVAGFAPVVSGGSARLRPPGALKDLLDEREFLASCIKCGQCVQVCPVEAIKLADLLDGFGVGTPYIEARDQACDFSCDGLQCVLACPTGALTHAINYPAETRMGYARLARPEACLAWQGRGFQGLARGKDYLGRLRYDEIDRWRPLPVAGHVYDVDVCDLCVRQCPIEIRLAQCADGKPPSGDPNQCPPRHAIGLERVTGADGVERMQPVVHDGCVGCGVCEMICPAEPAAIVIDIDQSADSVRGAA
ncbi:MAG: 4Fe-4S dicluster domain-containing protein [Thiotrichales bacterium]